MLLALLFILALGQPSLAIKSEAFAPGHYIQAKYTCMGENINPPLRIEGVPANAKSLALVVEDDDASLGPFDHWVVWNIPPVKMRIEENSQPGTIGLNGHKENKYTGPCPPNGMHQYHFKVYALDTKLDLPANSDKKSLMLAMQGHILQQAEMSAQFAKAMNRVDK